MKLKGQKFVNSDTCKGTSYAVSGVGHDIASIEITGRYPAAGWAINHEVHETVHVIRGVGKLIFRNDKAVDLMEGEVVTVPPKTPFAWDGDMTIVMVCEPAFNPDQYEIIEEANQ